MQAENKTSFTVDPYLTLSSPTLSFSQNDSCWFSDSHGIKKKKKTFGKCVTATTFKWQLFLSLSLSLSDCVLPVIEHSKYWTMCNEQHNAHTHTNAQTHTHTHGHPSKSKHQSAATSVALSIARVELVIVYVCDVTNVPTNQPLFAYIMCMCACECVCMYF